MDFSKVMYQLSDCLMYQLSNSYFICYMQFILYYLSLKKTGSAFQILVAFEL